MIESKRCIIFLVGILMMLISCNTDSDDFEDINKIEFQYSDSQQIMVRGAETDNTTITNFGVYAYYTESSYDEASSVPNFMFNAEVSRKTVADAWTYNPVMYWPVSSGVTFFAYSPYAQVGDPYIKLGSTLATVGAPQISYTVPNKVVDQRDLLISTPLYNQDRKSSSNVNNKLVIPFKHALSSIIFQAKMTGASTDPIKIRSITIGNLKNCAKVKYETPPSSSFSWEIIPAAEDQEYLLAIGSALLDLDMSKEVEYQSISDGQMMLLPQTIDPTDKITLVVEQTTASGVQTRTTTANLSALIPILESGKRYAIKLIVSGLADVNLTVSVSPWTDKNVNVPDFN